MLTVPGRVLAELSSFSSAIRPPNVVLVSAHDSSWMAALGAAALAYSTSSSASSSLPETTFGSVQLFLPLEGAGCSCVKEPELKPDSPNSDRNVDQSAVEKTSLSS